MGSAPEVELSAVTIYQMKTIKKDELQFPFKCLVTFERLLLLTVLASCRKITYIQEIFLKILDDERSCRHFKLFLAQHRDNPLQRTYELLIMVLPIGRHL